MKGRRDNWLVKGSNDVMPYCSGKRIIWRIEFQPVEGKGSRLYRSWAMNDLWERRGKACKEPAEWSKVSGWVEELRVGELNHEIHEISGSGFYSKLWTSNSKLTEGQNLLFAVAHCTVFGGAAWSYKGLRQRTQQRMTLFEEIANFKIERSTGVAIHL